MAVPPWIPKLAEARVCSMPSCQAAEYDDRARRACRPKHPARRWPCRKSRAGCARPQRSQCSPRLGLFALLKDHVGAAGQCGDLRQRSAAGAIRALQLTPGRWQEFWRNIDRYGCPLPAAAPKFSGNIILCEHPFDSLKSPNLCELFRSLLRLLFHVIITKMNSVQPNRQRTRSIAGRILLLLLGTELGLFVSDRFELLAYLNANVTAKGLAVLVALALVGLFLIVAVLWYLGGVLFGLRFQFGIRSLLFFIFLAALVFGWFSSHLDSSKRQQRAIAEIEACGGSAPRDLSKWGEAVPLWMSAFSVTISSVTLNLLAFEVRRAQYVSIWIV